MDNIEDLRRNIINSETFCFYPFTQISTNPSGHMKPCCYYGGTVNRDDFAEKGVYTIQEGDKFDDFWNSDSIRRIRKKIYEGNMPEHCSICKRDGAASMRVRSIKEYKNHVNVLENVFKAVHNDFIMEIPPSYLELKPSNLCNLKCLMCCTYDSSQIAKEIVELSEKYEGITIKNGRFIEIRQEPGIFENNAKVYKGGFEGQKDWTDNKEIWDNFERMVPHLEVVSFAGGEPTIMPSVMNALQFMVDTGHSKHITVFLSSNFTNLNKHFFNLMPHFKKFELIASIDGYSTVNDYARYPSKWAQVSANYSKAKQYMDNSNIKILTNITVNALNVLNLTDLLNFIEKEAEIYPFFKEWPFNINLLAGPEEQQVRMLPLHLKNMAINRLEEYLKTSKLLKEFPGLDSKIHLVINELYQPGNDNVFKVFKNRVKVLDEHRQIHIGDYIPELAEVFKNE
jgi:organic radical activating enzyme